MKRNQSSLHKPLKYITIVVNVILYEFLLKSIINKLFLQIIPPDKELILSAKDDSAEFDYSETAASTFNDDPR